MAMRLYISRPDATSRRVIVHLDEARVLESGEPDPEWCVDLSFAAYDEENPPMTGATEKAGGPNAKLEMRPMTREEVEAQHEAEAIALAREALAVRRAGEDQDCAAAADPFADGGRRVD